MKKNLRKLAMLGLTALMAAPAAIRADEEAEHDLKVRLESLEEAVDGFNQKFDLLGGVAFEGFLNLRYDDERNPSRGYLGEQTVPTTDATRTNNNGQSGIYARRGEAKFSGKMGASNVWSLGYDFVENKIKDMGVEFRDLPIIPFVDLGEYMQVIRVGQYRMPFGIMPQTSSSAILFPERSFINGGRRNASTQFGAPAATVGERVMGIQGRTKMKYPNIFAYDIQYGGFNSLNQDQAVGQNSLQNAYTNQDNDNDFSWAARLCLDHEYLYGILPEKSRIATGASYIRDSRNGNYQTGLLTDQNYDEIVGLELVVELANKMIVSNTEWLHRNQFNALTGLTAANASEGWYSDLGFDWLPLFTTPEKGDSLQTIFRYEQQVAFDAAGSFLPLARVAGGLKWSYLGGKNHTSITYYVMAPDNQFGGDARTPGLNRGTGISAPETQLIIQQQFAWETGKF